MFKKVAPLVAVTVALTGAVAAPASALSVRSEDGLCVFINTDEELELFRTVDGTPPREFRWGRTQAETQIKQRRDLEAPAGAEAKQAGQIEYYNNLIELAKSCLAGENVSIGGNYPSVPSAGNNGGGDSKPSKNSQSSLSSADGKPSETGMGVIVVGVIAVLLGLLAFAAPVIAPMLPPELRAMLNI